MYIYIYIYIYYWNEIGGGNDFSRKKNLSEMIRKFAEIQGSWRKQKNKKKERLTLLKHAVTT